MEKSNLSSDMYIDTTATRQRYHSRQHSPAGTNANLLFAHDTYVFTLGDLFFSPPPLPLLRVPPTCRILSTPKPIHACGAFAHVLHAHAKLAERSSDKPDLGSRANYLLSSYTWPSSRRNGETRAVQKQSATRQSRQNDRFLF